MPRSTSLASTFALRSKSSTFTVYSFLVAVFLALINLNVSPAGAGNNIPSLFETHGVILQMFVMTMLVYAITLQSMNSYYEGFTIEFISFVSGSLAPILLALILFPDRLGLLLLLVWAIVFVKVTYDSCRKLYQLYKQISPVSEFLNQLRRLDSRSHGTAIGNPPHAILCFLMATFIALMPLKFHSMDIKALSDTQSAIMSIFVITTIVYAVAWGIETKLQTGNNVHDSSDHLIIISKISLLFGSLATVLLVLILLPSLGLVILLIWTLFLVKLVQEACQKLHQLHRAISILDPLYQAIFCVSSSLDQLLNMVRRGNQTRLPV